MKELWKPISGWPNYLVSNLGRVKSFYLGKRLMKISLTGCIILNNKGTTKFWSVGALVLFAFKGPPPGRYGCNEDEYCARHLDDNRLNNRINNLAWGTHKDNYADAKRNGLRKISLETRTKMSVSRKGNENALGSRRTKEQRKKISAKLIGNKRASGKKWSNESRAKLRESLLASWAKRKIGK